MPKRAIYLTPKPLFLSSQNQSLRLATLNPLSLVNLSLVFYNSDINLTIKFYNREGILLNTVNVTQSITLKLKNSDYSMITWNDSNNYNVYGYIQEILPQSLEEYEQLLSDFNLDVKPFGLQNPRGSVIFTASQNWIIPTGVQKIKILAISGGGGGGGGYSSTYVGGGGGSSAIIYAEALVVPGTELNIIIGGGGSPGSGGANPTSGAQGGGTVIYVNDIPVISPVPGNGGGGATSSANGIGGSGGFVAAIMPGVQSYLPFFIIKNYSVAGNNANNQWGGSTPALDPTLTGTSSIYGYTTTPGSNANGSFGSGGPGGNVNSNGEAGIQGVVVIWWGD